MRAKIVSPNAGMGMSQEQAAATIQAAKLAQLNALNHNMDKMPANFLPPHLDLSKFRSDSPDRMPSGLSIEASKMPSSYGGNDRSPIDIRRDDAQPMDLGLDNGPKDSNGGNGGSRGNSSGEDEYGSDDDRN